MAIDTTKINEPNFPPPDKRARREEKDLGKSRRSRQNRTEGFVHWSKLILLFIFVAVFAAAIVCRVLHLFLPESKAWLTPEQVDKVDEFFVHGTIGVLVFEVMKRFLKVADQGEDGE